MLSMVFSEDHNDSFTHKILFYIKLGNSIVMRN